MLAMWSAYKREWPWFIFYSAIAAFMLRNWWNGRGKRRAAKVAAVVRDLGHRLAVVPAPSGGPR
jgi:hypothetical protein